MLKKESGTSLFYEYLKENHLILNSYIIDEFVELTRQYDTWEWYERKNILARKLHIIFETKGIDYYLNLINKILLNCKAFTLSEEAERIVDDFNNKLTIVINNQLSKMIVKEFEIDNTKFKVGYVKLLYKYRNDIVDVVKDNNDRDIDAIGMIITDKESISYRSIKDVDVSIIAFYFGGTGHKNAASHPKNNDKFQNILNSVF